MVAGRYWRLTDRKGSPQSVLIRAVVRTSTIFHSIASAGGIGRQSLWGLVLKTARASCGNKEEITEMIFKRRQRVRASSAPRLGRNSRQRRQGVSAIDSPSQPLEPLHLRDHCASTVLRRRAKQKVGQRDCGDGACKHRANIPVKHLDTRYTNGRLGPFKAQPLTTR